MSAKERPHIPVMTAEFLEFFEGKEISVFFEGTLGAGGHAALMLEAHPEIKRYLATDRDPQAIKLAGEVLKSWKQKIEFIHGDFADLDQHLKKRKVNKVVGFFLI